MRFFILIPAITALGVAGCQMPPQTAATPPAPEVAAPTIQDNMTAAASPTSDAQPLQSVLEPVGDAEPPVPETAMTSDILEEADAPEETDAPDEVDSAAPANDPDDGDATAPESTQVGDAAAIEDPTDTDIATSDQPATTPAPSTPSQTATPPVPQGASDTDHNTADMESEPATDVEEGMSSTELALAAPPPPPPPPAPPPPPPELDPQDLVGLDASSLESRLGEADFSRHEGVVETRQYRFTACVVDYFLYPQDSVTAVRNWAWRSPVIGRSLDATACRQALAERDEDG